MDRIIPSVVRADAIALISYGPILAHRRSQNVQGSAKAEYEPQELARS
jgi:hypothetical protein